MAEPTIAASFARALIDLAVSRGASRQALAERSGLDPEDLHDPDNRIPFAKYAALMRAGKALADDPALALHFGEAFDFADLSILGLIGEACETPAEALAQLNRYGRLGVDLDGAATADRFALSRDAGLLWMIDARKHPNDFPEMTESLFARIACGVRRTFGETQIIKAVHVTHPAPAYRDEYERIFRAPVVFESDRNALAIDEAWLTTRIATLPRYAGTILTGHADTLLKKLENSETARGRVESLLLPTLHTGEASMDRVAGKMGISRQTLFRKLKAEGVTFEKVLDELRRKLALHYLSEKNVSVNETAYLVGFSDPAAFSRAFKRWTGSSPRARRASKQT